MDLADFNQTKKDELNLEELIKCVSIGKTSIDQKTGKCNLSRNQGEVHEDETIRSADVDFNPMTLVVCVQDFQYECDDENQRIKKFKATVSEQDKSLSSCHDLKSVESPTKTDKLAAVCSSQRLKRKRHLNDTESVCLNKINDKNNKTNDTQLPLSFEATTSPIPTSFEDLPQVVAKLSGCVDDISTSTNSENDTQNVLTPPSNEAGDFLDLQQLTLKEELGIHVSEATNNCLVKVCDESIQESMTSDGLQGDQSNAVANPTQRTGNGQPTRCKRKSGSNNETEHRSLRKRIRKTLPPVKARQTPMGLPRPLRLKKAKFSLEEIYTNKNYSTPVPKHLETIFEYPKEEKDGSVRYSEKRRKQRAMAFYTNPADRPGKKRTKLKKRSTRRSKRDADVTIDTKLIQTLADIDQHLLTHDLSP